jgi:hypothetical protein
VAFFLTGFGVSIDQKINGKEKKMMSIGYLQPDFISK